MMIEEIARKNILNVYIILNSNKKLLKLKIPVAYNIFVAKCILCQKEILQRPQANWGLSIAALRTRNPQQFMRISVEKVAF
jgi:hypothetical protein